MKPSEFSGKSIQAHRQVQEAGEDSPEDGFPLPGDTAWHQSKA